MKYLLYAILAACLFSGAKTCKKNEWNEDVLSYTQTKSFLGFCSLIIIFHHCSLRTCAPWLESHRITHGLDAFVFVGYLCVSVFFFCSGYGMYTSYHRKKEFFNGYIRRIMTVLLPATVIWITFFVIEQAKGMKISKPIWINTYDYIWYIPAIIYLYLAFYIAFHLVKNEKAGIVVILVLTGLYFFVSMIFSPGEWWYNTPYLFSVGIITARHTEKIGMFFKKRYPFLVILSFAVTMVGFFVANYFNVFVNILGFSYREGVRFVAEVMGQMISALSFVTFVILIGMKIRIRNKLLLLLGSFTLEIYLVHPLFVQLFSFAFIQDTVKPLYHIQNPYLYSIVVVVISIPIAYALHRIIAMITGKK